MTTPDTPPSALVDSQVKRDLCSTLRLHLSMVGIWLTDPQAAALVDTFVARLDGEWRVRRLRQATGDRNGGSA
jgi:hypothetical protein